MMLTPIRPKIISRWGMIMMMLSISLIVGSADAFCSSKHSRKNSPFQQQQQRPQQPLLSQCPRPTRGTSMSPSTSSLDAAADDLFENFKRLWGGGFNNKEDDRNSNPASSSSSYSDDDGPAGTTLIASIPVESIKPGGLRLFLMFYLMGEQNTPDRGTWQAHQPSSSSSSSLSGGDDDYVVEMYFRDATAMLSIELLEDEIRITRCGSVPSTPYLMQESVIVQGILDELDQCAFDESVSREHRLLVPEPPNAIDLARGSLSFG